MEDYTVSKLTTDSNPDQACPNVITMTSSSVCSVYSIGAFMQLFETYWWLFGTICLVSGFFLALFGRALLRIVLFIIGLFGTVFLVIVIFYSTFLNDQTADWVFWTVLAGSALVGALIGFLFTKLARFGGAVLAGFGGFLVGMVIFEAWLYMYELEWLLWVSGAVLALLFFGLGYKFFEPAVIGSTSFIGSYFIARGVGCFVDNASFPSVITLVDQVESGGIDAISPYYYIYFTAILLMTIIGCVVQYKMWKRRAAKKKDAKGYYYTQAS